MWKIPSSKVCCNVEHVIPKHSNLYHVLIIIITVIITIIIIII